MGYYSRLCCRLLLFLTGVDCGHQAVSLLIYPTGAPGPSLYFAWYYLLCLLLSSWWCKKRLRFYVSHGYWQVKSHQLEFTIGILRDKKGNGFISFNRTQMCMYASARFTLIRKVGPVLWSAANMQSKRPWRDHLNLIALFGAASWTFLFSLIEENRKLVWGILPLLV